MEKENGNINSKINGLKINEELQNDYCNFATKYTYQLNTSGVPSNLWLSLFFKLKNKIYDAGNFFQMIKIISEDCNTEWQVNVIENDGISTSNSACIFLIDHAWTYEVKDAKTSLETCTGLLERMCDMMNINFVDGGSLEDKINCVLAEMWKYNGTYYTGSTLPEESLPVWYVMDEFGSRIQHDGDPNCRVIPFYYEEHGICYSLLFPIKELKKDDEITRNYVETHPVDDITRDAQMLPWFPEDLTHIEISQEEPPTNFFLSDRVVDVLLATDCAKEILLPKNRKIKVYALYQYIQEYLTDERYEIVDSANDADVIWYSSHFHDFNSLCEFPWKRVNQFPGEEVLTVKDLLAIVSRRMSEGGEQPPWMLQTFCLKRELNQFVSCFQRNQKECLNNVWIVKPWNLARGLDHTVTNNLNHILRLPSTGPKIAQKYLHNPVLFHREDINTAVKFDLRFIVLLLSVQPLKVAVYENFWIRFANKSFTLNDFEDYQKHFTVNNYNESNILQMYCDKFIAKFESQNPCYSWESIKAKIYTMMKQVFEAAVMKPYPAGIANNPQSKGSYGFDIMIDWVIDERGEKQMQPKLLEVNFNSDCKRACEYYPDFFNDLFNVMFLDESADSIAFL